MFNKKEIKELRKRVIRLETAIDWICGSNIRVPIKDILMELVAKLGYKVGDYPTYIEETDCCLSIGKLMEKLLTKLNLEIKGTKPTEQSFKLIKRKKS